MRLTRIDLTGFGCLSGFSCELAPGLNVFYGDNEAGKSTLQQAICALLYGFYDGDRARTEETARHERYRPWNGGPYRGSLAYELEDGRRFEVRRDFSTPDVHTQVLDPAFGTDVTGQFPRKRHGCVGFAREHLGMSRGVFQSSAFISQGEVFEIEKTAPTQIGDAIAAMADSGRRDVSAAQAIARLDAAIAKIGSDRARTADLPVARERLARARAELKAQDEARQAVAEKAAHLERLRQRLTQVAEESARTDYLVRRAEADDLRRRLRGLEEAERQIEDATAAAAASRRYTGLTAEARDEMLALEARAENARDLARRLRDEMGAVDPVSDDERLEYAALREAVGSLTEEQIADLQRCAYADRPDGGLRSLFGRTVRALARFGRALVRAILRRKTAEPNPEPPALPAAGALALLERHRRYLVLRPRVERESALARDIENAEAAVAALEARLKAALEAVGVANMSELRQAWAESQRLAEARRAREDAEKRRSLLLAGRSPAELREALAAHEGAIEQALARRPGLAGSESGQPLERLRDALARLAAEERECSVEAARLEQELAQSLSGRRPRAELEEEIAHLEREVSRLEKARTALTMARSAIQAAMESVYRDFAPAVNAFLSEGLEAATDGKYRRAHVDPATLRVSLLVPETGQVISDPPVSHGTRTLLYVLMRVGLARHMSNIAEPVPLVLDDPFVDLDERRLGRMLDFVLGLAGRMQVLIFTKDAAVARWFEHAAAGAEHKLHRLFTEAAAAL